MSDKYLYSPWRLDYILSEKPGDCILCRHLKADADEEHLIIHRARHSYIMLNRYPYNNGHIMIVPYAHSRNLMDLPSEVMNELGHLMQVSETALREVYSCDGINVGMNLGVAAGAGIEEHLHLHMVPRWNGDCSFMSVVSGLRVIPEAFEVSYAKLRQQYLKLLSEKV